MVVCLVFEQKQPVLIFPINRDSNLHSTGVDLLGLIELVKLTLAPQIFDSNCSNVHQVDRFCSADRLPDCKIIVKGFLQEGTFGPDTINSGKERCVAAMIRPVGINHPNLGNSRITILTKEVLLTEGEICCVHGKTVTCGKVGETCGIKLTEPLKHSNLCRSSTTHHKSCRHRKIGLTAFDRVNNIFFDPIKHLIRDVSAKNIDAGRTDNGTFFLGNKLNTLCSTVSTLIKLARQILNGKHPLILCESGSVCDNINLRLRKHSALCIRKKVGIDVIDIVAVDDSERGNSLHSRQSGKLTEERMRFICKSRFLLDKYSENHCKIPTCQPG